MLKVCCSRLRLRWDDWDVLGKINYAGIKLNKIVHQLEHDIPLKYIHDETICYKVYAISH